MVEDFIFYRPTQLDDEADNGQYINVPHHVLAPNFNVPLAPLRAASVNRANVGIHVNLTSVRFVHVCVS